jgi:hypothetical protein
MSMLPEFVFEDECDPIHETKFFSILHQKEVPTDNVPSSETTASSSSPSSYETFQVTVTRGKRVIGKNYSYPLQYDPALYSQEVYD